MRRSRTYPATVPSSCCASAVSSCLRRSLHCGRYRHRQRPQHTTSGRQSSPVPSTFNAELWLLLRATAWRAPSAALWRYATSLPRPDHSELSSDRGLRFPSSQGAKVVVYSKSYCPFCTKTKSLFDSLGVSYTAIELDEVDGGDAIQATLLDITGQRTVPNVWVGGKHLGGNDGACVTQPIRTR